MEEYAIYTGNLYWIDKFDIIFLESKEEHMDKEAVLSEALQELGVSLSELKSLKETLEQAKEAERQAQAAKREAKFSQIRAQLESDMVQRKELKVAPGALDALAALYLYAEETAEVKFSLDGKSADLKSLLDTVLAGIEAVQVFGESGAGALAPNLEPSGVDTNRVNDIISIATRRFAVIKE